MVDRRLGRGLADIAILGKLMHMNIHDSVDSSDQYTDNTALTLAKELLENCNADTKIAVVSAPSVFIQLKNLMVSHVSAGS